VGAADGYERLGIPAWVPWIGRAVTLVLAVSVVIVRANPSGVPHVHPGHFGPLLILPIVLATVPLLIDGLPILPSAVVVLGGTGWLVFGWPTYNDTAPFYLVLLVFWAGIGSGLARGLGVVAVAIGLFAVPQALGYGNFAPWYVAFGLGWGAGFALQQLVLKVAELQDAQAELAHKAAAEERQRIAHELHDVIAHTLAVTMLHLTGARLALQTGDPDEAVDALLEAERLGRTSLSDVRRTVGLLAEDDGHGPAPPQPGAVQLTALVAEFKGAGLDVSLSVNGDLSCVSPAAGLGLYRIAQESLANVVKHAPGSATEVCCDVDGDSVRLTVCNRPIPATNGNAASGMGLPGMRQRAEALAGRVQAGPSGDTWLVEAVFPA
jgi:signal transduction histidine kinase